MRVQRVLAFVGAAALLAPTARAATGGPDAGGYTWRDSREPGVTAAAATFIGTPATVFPVVDESITVLTLPSPFAFYGLAPQSTVYISDNGWMSFVDPRPSTVPVNPGIPDSAVPNAVIAFNWDDLNTTAGYIIHGAIAGGYGFEVRMVQRLGGATLRTSIELYATGRVKLVFSQIGNAGGLTIGTEDETGTKGTQLLKDGVAAPGFAYGTSYAVELLPPSRLQCPAAPATTCGQSVLLNTSGSPSDVYGYSCAPGTFLGPQLVVPVDIPQTSSLTATLSGFGTLQLGTFILRSCDERTCAAGGGTTAVAPVLPPGRAYVAIDGVGAADAGPVTLTLTCGPPLAAVHTGWFESPGEGIVPTSPPFGTRGDPAEFAYASFPSKGDPSWTPTPNPNFVDWVRPSTLCAYACGAALEFNYYRTCLYLPTTVSSLVVSAASVDDGIALRVNGTLINTGQLGAYLSPNLAGNPALVLGALNDIEVIQVDDCCSSAALQTLTFTVDGRPAQADLVDSCRVQAAAVPIVTPVCLGQSVVLDASPSASGLCTLPLEYRFREGTTPLGPFSTNPLRSVTPTTSTTYSVDVLCPDGCGCQQTTDIPVVVIPGMTHAVPALATLCFGGSVVLGGSPTVTGGTPPYNYLWTPNLFLDDPTIANPTATPPAAQLYTLDVVDALGCRIVTSELVDGAAPIPSTIGNTLRCLKSGLDVSFSWVLLADALSYNLKSDVAKPFAAPVFAGNSTGTTARLTGVLPPPPPLVFYRVNGVGCGGEGL